MTQNLVILPGCPKAEKRTPPFQSSSRATLRPRPPGNRRRHKTLARNIDRAILGDQNGQENLVNFLLLNLQFFYLTGEVLRVVFSRTFLGASLPRSPRRWLLHCFCWQMIYSTPRVDLFCALCTSWSVAKYCHLCWQLILFDTRSAALHYCTQAVSGTVCLVFRYLLRIKYSACCTRCSEFWNSVREKHNSQRTNSHFHTKTPCHFVTKSIKITAHVVHFQL